MPCMYVNISRLSANFRKTTNEPKMKLAKIKKKTSQRNKMKYNSIQHDPQRKKTHTHTTYDWINTELVVCIHGKQESNVLKWDSTKILYHRVCCRCAQAPKHQNIKHVLKICNKNEIVRFVVVVVIVLVVAVVVVLVVNIFAAENAHRRNADINTLSVNRYAQRMANWSTKCTFEAV